MNVVTMSVITASVTILCIVRLSIIMQSRYDVCYAQFHFAECRYTEYFATRILNKNKKKLGCMSLSWPNRQSYLDIFVTFSLNGVFKNTLRDFDRYLK
jgi:hypothetical protein